MNDEKKIAPDFGTISFIGARPANLPKPRIVKSGTKNKYHAPIEVKRPIRSGARVLSAEEPIKWENLYN